MRMNSYLVFVIFLSGSLLAQEATNLPQSPSDSSVASPMTANVAPAEMGNTNAPATKKKTASKKKASKKPATKKKEPGMELKTVPLVPGPAIVEANHVNVRGQAKLNSEVVTRLTKDQKVTVLQEIVRNNSGPDEPSAWAKIVLPSEVHVWVNSGFVDANTKSVKSRKLNVRSGPGENFSVLGRMLRGEPVTQVNTKGDWLEIEAPTNAYAFVAAQYLKQEVTAPPAANPTEVASTPASVTNQPAIVPTTTETPVVNNQSTPNAAAVPQTAPIPEIMGTPPVEEPPPKRIVEREGIVRGTGSIQAPTSFQLVSPENGRAIDYLYTSSPALDLRRYKGLRIVVTGEEGLEERWGNTPVITIQKIQVVE
jgi:uncharacterized protein YgiM (DUF1202 family)